MRRDLICYLALFLMLPLTVAAQNLRFENHREIAPPEDALILIGPFYSDLSFTQTIGYRYVKSRGTGVDYLFGNRRGEIKEDGGDMPMILEVQSKNYLMLTEHMDLDLSFTFGAEYYPFDTQENELYVDMIDEGGEANFTMEFSPTPLLKGSAYDKVVYRSDYVDPRGRLDRYGGSQYEYLRNTLGTEWDWLIDKDMNLAFSLSREDNFPMDSEFDDQEYTKWAEDIIYEQMLSPFIVAGAKLEFWQSDYSSSERTDSSLQGYSVFADVKATDFSMIALEVGYSEGSVDDTTTSDSVMEGSDDSDLGAVIGSVSLDTEMTEELSHTLGVARKMDGGFNTAFEIKDGAWYKLKWKTPRTTVSVYTEYDSVDPRSDTYSDYIDWKNGMTISYVLSDFALISYGLLYSLRDNDDTTGSLEEDIDESLTSDYTTLANNIELSVALTRSINLITYIGHEDRDSDSPDLDYSRFTGSVLFKYHHKF